jgi:hypothetical protein
MLHVAAALIVSVTGLLALLLRHLLLLRSKEPAEMPNEMPNEDEPLLPVGMVVRRRNLRLWVSLRQLPRGQR